MAFTKYLIPALAIAGLATAQSSSCKGSKSIENQEDANGISGCRTYDGDITIEDVVKADIRFDQLERLRGSLKSKNSSITMLSAPKLATIDDSFTLSALTALTALEFDSLTSVNTIDFEALPKLQSLGFTKGVTKADRVRITNTDLYNLNGIDLESVNDMEITNNPHLTEVNVNQITNATGYINFAANHKDLKITFPNLQTAQNMTFRNTSSVQLPSLEKTDGLLGFYSNFFEDFIAPNLTSTGDLVFTDNSVLTNISLPILKTVKGAFQIANNTALKSVTIPKLETITGALDFSGNFSKVELPNLKEIRGGFNMQSSGTFECQSFKDLRGDVIRGEFTCRSGVKNPKSDNSGNDDGDDADTTTTSGFAVPVAEAPAGILIGLLGLLQFIL
ncbi:hypothetical protein FQN57_006681 [Myotisia sp. PD_48]|nr:hypothetical protein FQN57_006681 [Myotisia sp. PD_48]